MREETGRRRGLTVGTDVVSAVLWRTMAERFSTIAHILEQTVPVTNVRRIANLAH
ncbi:hypothetical protein ABIE28_002453 [Devosia sp. 2618]